MIITINLTDEQVEWLKSVSIDDFPKYLNGVIGTHIAIVKATLQKQEEDFQEKCFEHLDFYLRSW